MEGCSGSTFVKQVLRRLLPCCIGDQYRDGGIPDGTTDWEMFKGPKNLAYQRLVSQGATDPWRKALLQQCNANKLSGTAYIVNSDLASGSAPLEMTHPALVACGARFASAYRENALDVTTCEVRDCFWTEFGLSLDARGQPLSKLTRGYDTSCFYRSRYSGMRPRVKLHVETLQSALGRSQTLRRPESIAGRLAPLGIKTDSVRYEDLEAFQFGPEEMERSAPAWATLMRSWGYRDVCPPSAVAKCLTGFNMSRHRPSPHRESIVNHEEVYRGLTREQREMWWRGPP